MSPSLRQSLRQSVVLVPALSLSLSHLGWKEGVRGGGRRRKEEGGGGRRRKEKRNRKRITLTLSPSTYRIITIISLSLWNPSVALQGPNLVVDHAVSLKSLSYMCFRTSGSEHYGDLGFGCSPDMPMIVLKFHFFRV